MIDAIGDRMRIAYVVTTLAHGGAEAQAVALAERMHGRGHDVLLLVLRAHGGGEVRTELAPVYLGMDKRLPSVVAGLWVARRVLGEFGADVVHSHTYPANATARLARLLGTPGAVVTSIHNVNEGGWARMLAYGLSGGLSTVSVAVCDAAAERFVRLKAVKQAKCRVIRNGIDTRSFAPDEDRRQRVRAALGAGERFVWLAVGRIAAAKDYPNLLRAWARLQAEVPGTELWVAGAGERGEVERLSAELAVSGTVRWLGQREDLPGLLDAADGFVLSSAWEGMPLAVAEAMAMQKPVVATAVGGVGELVGEMGMLVAARDAEALAAAMLRVQTMTADERQAMGTAARARVVEGFEIEQKAAAWEALYGAVAAIRR